MVTKSTKEADAEFQAAIEESVAVADANAPATEEEEAVESVAIEAEAVPEEEKGFLIFKATADEAIAYIRASEDRDEVYALAEAEEKGKSRKTVIEAALKRVTELNLEQDEARAAALASTAEEVEEVEEVTEEPTLEAPELETESGEAGEVEEAEEAEAPAPVDMGTPDDYPLEGVSWEGELGRYSEVKHITRTMNPLGGLDDRVMTPTKVNEYIESHFLDGYELIKVVPQGFGQQGLSLLWVLGKVRADIEPRYTEIWHIQRTLTESPMAEGGVTGFQADQYLNSFLRDGWQLFVAQSLRTGEPEIPMLWVMVR